MGDRNGDGQRGANLRAPLVVALLVVLATGCGPSIDTQALTAPATHAPVAAMAIGLVLLLGVGAAMIFAWSGQIATLMNDTYGGPKSAPIKGHVTEAAPIGVAVTAMILWMLAASLVTIGQVARSADNQSQPQVASASLVQVTLKSHYPCSSEEINQGDCAPTPNPADGAATKSDIAATLFAVLALICTALCTWMRSGRGAAFTVTIIAMAAIIPTGVIAGLWINYVGYPHLTVRLIGFNSLPAMVFLLLFASVSVTFIAACETLITRT
jgi:hypothetical protein